MAPIENIGSNLPPVDRLKQRDRVGSARPEKGGQPGQVGPLAAQGSRGDKAESSTTAKKLAESQGEVARFQELLHSLRNEDPGKLSALRQRIDEGEFNLPVVQAQVAETIGRLPQFQSLLEKPSGAPPSRRLTNSIQDRISTGQFQTDEVLQQVAVNILNEIGAP